MEKITSRLWKKRFFAAAAVWIVAVASAAWVWTLAFSAPTPHADAGNVAMVVAKMLEQMHYTKKPLNDATSRQFLEFYLESPALDFNHMTFFQSDVDEFRLKYSDRLDDMTLRGDVRPAYEIFARYLQRLEQRVEYSKQVLKEKLDFTKDEWLETDRRELPWPANEAEAKALWRLWVKHDVLLERLNKEKPEEIVAKLTRRYDRMLRLAKEMDSEQVLEAYLTALGRAYDPHTDYLSASDLENFNIQMKLSLFGIGCTLQDDDGYAKVVSIVPGGPAAMDKRLKPNDRIVAVAQGDGAWVDVVGLPLQKVVEQIRGKKGTVVRLMVTPADAPDSRLEISLVRDEIKLTESEAKGKLVEMTDADGKVRKYGYIDLPSFYADMQVTATSKSTTRDVQRLIERLKKEGAEGLILDLRRNGGGALNEAINLTGLFIKGGPVVEVKDFAGNVHVYTDNSNRVVYDGPLIVLTTHASASASEIVAGALQDYGRAVIVGERQTFGKGTVQSMLPVGNQVRLPNGQQPNWGALKVTIQKFYRVSGGSTQNKGIVPDIRIPSPMDYRKVAESALKNAMPYDEVAKAKYEPTNHIDATIINQLKKLSEARLARDPEFQNVLDDIERLKASLEQKSVSLNEAKRIAERDADAAREEARKKARAERAKLNGAPFKTTDITIAMIEGRNQPAFDRNAANQANGEKPAEPEPDPVFEESLRILTDLIRIAPTAAR
jgi:carboxyl-terminal processing protease